MKVIDYEETMKCLDEVADSEEKTYAKWLLEWAIEKRTFDAVPMSAIEKIKTEIEQAKDEPTDEESKNYNLGLDVAKTIIKKHTKNLIEKG